MKGSHSGGGNTPCVKQSIFYSTSKEASALDASHVHVVSLHKSLWL